MVSLSAIKIYIKARLFPNYRINAATEDAMRETFKEEQYKWLVTDLKPNTFAVDIGAFVGDSAMYLAMNQNITHIEAYEPFPDTYERAKANIIKAGLDKKVNLHNMGVSDKETTVKLPTSPQGMDSKMKNNMVGKDVPVTTINKILEGKSNIIIKCDCEGEEHKIFVDGTNLSEVYKIQMEYHKGTGLLINFLERNDFDVRKEILSKNSVTAGEVGLLYAQRKKN